MARGGGGGGHSSGGSFGGGHSSFGSFGGGHSSYRGSSFGSSHSSYSRSSYNSYPHHSHYYGGGGYYGRPTPPPRRYYGSSGRGSSSGCITTFIIIFILFAIIGGIGRGMSSNGSTDVRSTEKREKMSTAGVNYSNTWFIDEAGWISNGKQLRNGLESFYQKTGVQPLIYIYDYDGTNAWNNANAAKEIAEKLYAKIFEGDEGHLLFVYFACPNDGPDIMEGNYLVICGKKTETVMDENAQEILMSQYKYYYEEPGLSIEQFFSKTFSAAGKAIMKGPMNKRLMVIIIVAIIATVIIVSLSFKWWKAKKAQKNKEAEDLEKILSTPLETFGKTDADDLKEKYDNN